jgi:hypothetical protein
MNIKYLLLLLIILVIMMIFSSLIIINSQLKEKLNKKNSNKGNHKTEEIKKVQKIEENEEIHIDTVKNKNFFKQQQEELQKFEKNIKTETLQHQNETKIIPKKNKCRNTKQGKIWITDNQGYICKIEQVNQKTKCCEIPNLRYFFNNFRFSCSSCNNYGCCIIYEMCVSCCMNNDVEKVKFFNKGKRKSVWEQFEKKKNQILFKKVKTIFDFCTTRCRTSSKSVMNENSYKSNYKHCFDNLDPIDID